MSTRRSIRLQGMPPPKEPEPAPKKSNAKSRKQKSSPKSKSPSPKSSPKSSRKHKSPEASAASASTIPVFYYIHNNHVRPIIAVPINDLNLWPTPNAPFFRSTGTSNIHYDGLFKDTWFPFVSIKNSDTMPEYLETKPNGFIIKSSFLINADDETNIIRPKWMSELLNDYPIEMDEEKLNFLKTFNNSYNIIDNNKASFKSVKDFLNKYNNTEPIYKDILLLFKNEITTCFYNFINYFSYPWQVMVSIKLGGGYWNINPNLREYIKSKFESTYNTSHITLPPINPPTANLSDNVDESIRFLENHHAQMNETQIMDLSQKEIISVGRPNVSTASAMFLYERNEPFTNLSNFIEQMETKYNYAIRINRMLSNPSNFGNSFKFK